MTVQKIAYTRFYGLAFKVSSVRPARGRGASVSAYAYLTNQLQCSWVDPACAWKKQ